MYRWLRRRWRRGRRWLTQTLEAWRDARFERAEWQRIHQQEALQRMSESHAIELAQARATYAELDQRYVEALKTVAREEEREAAQAEADARAWQRLEGILAERTERLEAREAAYQRRVDQQQEAFQETVRAQERRRAREEQAEALEEARTTAAQALEAQQQLEAPLLSLVHALLPEGRKTYLGRVGIREVDVVGLNRTLQRSGLAIQHDLPSRDQPEMQEYPELLVKVRTGEASWGAATRFWLEKVEAAAEPVDPKTGIPLKNIVRGV
jgi:hypothetical protein